MAAITRYTPRLKHRYDTELKQQLAKDLQITNPMRVPKLEKIVVSVGIGNAADDKKTLEVATNTLAKITGQAPIKTVAKKSIASFKLRQGSVVGLKVTLRGTNMYEFLDRLISIVLPRTRDFRGLAVKSLDSKGNYSLGLVEQSVFPELSFEETSHLHGIEITIATTAQTADEGYALLKGLGIPFEAEKGEQ